MLQETYHIKLPQFEGPFDLLLFFIQRDELDIHNIPIHKITLDFLDYIHRMNKLNMEIASEFILFASILMKIKSSSILPRKSLEDDEDALDFKQLLQDRLIEYKKIKNLSKKFSELELERMQKFTKGNHSIDAQIVGGFIASSTECASITSYQLAKAMSRIMKRYMDKNLHPTHNVLKHPYSSQESRTYLLETLDHSQPKHFEKIFKICKNRLQAIYLFLAILELVEEKFLQIMMGKNYNDFYIQKALKKLD